MVFPKDFPIRIPDFKDTSIIRPGIIVVFSMIIGPLFIIEPVVKNITFQERFHRHSFMHELTNVLFEQKGRDPVVLISRDIIYYYVYGLDLVVSQSIVDGVAIIIFPRVVFLCYFVPIEDRNFRIEVFVI
jgi:hypothetical protein